MLFRDFIPWLDFKYPPAGSANRCSGLFESFIPAITSGNEVDKNYEFD